MKSEILIRNETNTDIDTITEVTIAAFNTLEISNHTEQFIIDALRGEWGQYLKKDKFDIWSKIAI